jgi:sterol desaturase/sphingolipid hydroxylase (fatty acid hydroxylase superfamily)
MLIALPDLKSILLAIMVFVPLERLFALRHEQKILRKWWHHDTLYLLCNVIFIGTGINLILLVTILLASYGVPAAVTTWVGSLPFWVQLPMMIVLSDICFYTVHRIFHEVPLLWKFHAVHHSSEEMDWLASFRVHPIDQICTKGASLIPVFALGFTPEYMAVYFFIYHWQSLFIHSNNRFKFGFLEKWIASPRFHHWHHANEREAFDKNYASQLPFLDRVFGTLYLPDRMPSAYGISEEMPEGYIKQLAHPFQQIADSKQKNELASAQK